VALGGTLELAFADGVDLASQIGQTIDLFDWDGVVPTGAFTVASPYVWNLSNLYSTGEVTLAALASLPGDYNNDAIVNLADYTVWRDNLGASVHNLGTGSASVSVPEPATATLLSLAAISTLIHRRRLATMEPSHTSQS